MGGREVFRRNKHNYRRPVVCVFLDYCTVESSKQEKVRILVGLTFSFFEIRGFSWFVVRGLACKRARMLVRVCNKNSRVSLNSMMISRCGEHEDVLAVRSEKGEGHWSDVVNEKSR